MKRFLSLLSAVALATTAIGAATPMANVTIAYEKPERFTDFRLQGRPELETTRIFADSLRPVLARELARRQPGARLTITFTDIDLAGRYEPWRGPRFYDIRFYRDETPLRLQFRYTLTDARGGVLASGTETVYEAYYQYYRDYELTEVSFNPAYYDVRALARWEGALLRRGRTAAAPTSVRPQS